MEKRNYAEITPDIIRLTNILESNGLIDRELYDRYQVNRGLRDLNGKGILTGLTEISEVNGLDKDGKPIHGELFYRGYNIRDLVDGFLQEDRYGFEEITYLLLFGSLPDQEQLKNFEQLLGSYRSLPNSFVRDLMFPQLALYSYQAYDYYRTDSTSFFIHDPVPELSTAENILHMLRLDSKYTPIEAAVLDMALVLHAEHGGGNNSTFTTHVVTSTGTDTYSAIAASLGSLKGPKHGGANIKVVHMFDEIKQNVRDWSDEDEITAYVQKILNKEAFDRTGLVYGIGHAIYSRSDPRAVIFRQFVEKLAKEKGLDQEYRLYSTVEKAAPMLISAQRKMYKGVSANVDFYSGFVYQMLGLPEELFTPIFAIARISGWSAHRIEELLNGNRIIRPSYKAVQNQREYVRMADR